jgi:hypothetical protein
LSFFTGVPWWPMPCSLGAPQPFTVRATIARGRWPFCTTFSSFSALLISSGSWPSTIRAMKPNASAFFASVSALCCGLTKSLWASSLQLKIGTTFVSAWSAMKSIASQIWPSRDSPSPMMQNTFRLVLSCLAAAPRPAATESPWPSEPVAASAKGKPTCGWGWPSIGLSIARRVMASSRVIGRADSRPLPVGTIIPPRSAYAAYRIGTAWPSDNTNRSAARSHGFFGSHRIWWYMSTVITCASDSAVDGCPLPAAVVISTDSLPISTAFLCTASSKLIGYDSRGKRSNRFRAARGYMRPKTVAIGGKPLSDVLRCRSERLVSPAERLVSPAE